MTTLPAPTTLTRVADRARDLAEAVYSGPAPTSGPTFAAKARRGTYLVLSSIAWPLAALLVTGLIASLFR
ncbi:MAG: hypothetical protein L6367_14205 [Cellulomonas sp.]|nr:hypothetical protein [Cellulomonas sp.]